MMMVELLEALTPFVPKLTKEARDLLEEEVKKVKKREVLNHRVLIFLKRSQEKY